MNVNVNGVNQRRALTCVFDARAADDRPVVVSMWLLRCDCDSVSLRNGTTTITLQTNTFTGLFFI